MQLYLLLFEYYTRIEKISKIGIVYVDQKLECFFKIKSFVCKKF